MYLKRFLILISCLLVSNAFAGECTRCYYQRATLAVECMATPSLYYLYPNWCRDMLYQATSLHNYLQRYEKHISLSPSIKKINRTMLKWVSNDPCDRCISQIYTIGIYDCMRKESAVKKSDNCRLNILYREMLYFGFISRNSTMPIRRS